MIHLVSAIVVALGAAAASLAPEPKLITVQEGTNLKVSVPADGDRFVFDLMGRVWVASSADGIGTAITDRGTVHGRPVFSPDGTMIASEMLHNGLQHIAVMRPDGSEHRRVTFGDFDHRTPAWSPDGKQLLFSSNRGGDYSIWALDVTTLALEQRTFAGEDEWDPVFNSAGTKLAYVGGNANSAALYELERGQLPRALLREANALYAPSWRPDDAVITYVRPTASGGELRMLILSNPPITKRMTAAENVFPHPVQWTGPRTVLYTADGHIKEREFGANNFRDLPFRAIITVGRAPARVESKRATQLANKNLAVRGITGVAVRDDGSFIASALGDLWEFDADGKVRRQLTNDAFVDSLPEWSSGDDTVVFVSDRSGEPERWVMNLASGEVQRAADIDEAIQKSAKTEAPAPMPLSWVPAVGKGRLIVRAGRVFDGLRTGYLEQREIVIEDGRILTLRPWSHDGARDDGAEYLDASDHTVMPGLIDLGVRQSELNRERDGRAWLAAGVTSIRASVDDIARAVEQRESWLSGRRAGPRLHYVLRACDESVREILADPATPIPDHLNALSLIEICPGNNAESIERTVTIAHERGFPVSSPDPYTALMVDIDELSLAGPRFGPGGVRRELSAAVYNDVIDTVAELQINIVSNLSRHAPGVRQRQVQQQLFRIIGRGGRVATGSGAPINAASGSGLHDELQRLVSAGLQPFQVLKMATVESARVLGRDHELGSIAAGQLADLAVVRGDPLADITAARDTVAVLLAGRRFPRESLDQPGLRASGVEKFYN